MNISSMQTAPIYKRIQGWWNGDCQKSEVEENRAENNIGKTNAESEKKTEESPTQDDSQERSRPNKSIDIFI